MFDGGRGPDLTSTKDAAHAPMPGQGVESSRGPNKVSNWSSPVNLTLVRALPSVNHRRSISARVICLFIFFSFRAVVPMFICTLVLHGLGIGRMSPRFCFVSSVSG